MRIRQLVLTLLILATYVTSSVEQMPVAEAVKWLELPTLSSDTGLTARVASMMVEAYRARHRLAIEALAEPAKFRPAYIAQNTQRLAVRVRAHLSNYIATQTFGLQDEIQAEKLTTAVRSGLRSAQLRIQSTPLDQLMWTPLPPGLGSWKLRLREWQRKRNPFSAIRDWRASRLLRQDRTQPTLQTLLVADMEKYLAQVQSQIAEVRSQIAADQRRFAEEQSHIAETQTEAMEALPPIPAQLPKPPRRTYLKHIKGKLRKIIE